MWIRLISATAGVWLMFAPHVLSLGEFTAKHDRIIGPLIAMFALIAMSQATRPVRWAVTALGAWLVVAPFLLGYWSTDPRARNNDVAVGIICIAASSLRGKITKEFGGGWSSLWKRGT